MKMRWFLLALLSFAFAISAATPPRNVYVKHVELVYAKFGQQVKGSEYFGREDTLTEQPRAVQLRYLTPELVDLIARDQKCSEDAGGICNLDFSVLWYSQDPAATSLKFKQSSSPGIVSVTVIRSGRSEPMVIRYKVVMTNAGPRIDDILYDSDTSLVSILQKPIEN